MSDGGAGQDAFFIQFKMKSQASKLPHFWRYRSARSCAVGRHKDDFLSLEAAINRSLQVHSRRSLGMKAQPGPRSLPPGARPADRSEPFGINQGPDD